MEDPAGIVAEIKDIPLYFVAANLRLKLIDRRLQLTGGLISELINAEISRVSLGSELNRLGGGCLAHELHVERLVKAGAYDRKRYWRAGRSLQQVSRLPEKAAAL